MINEKEKEDEMKELVIARLDIMPPYFKLSIGDKGTFTKSELIDHVRKDDVIGREITKMQLSFIKALVSGRITETLTQNKEIA